MSSPKEAAGIQLFLALKAFDERRPKTLQLLLTTALALAETKKTGGGAEFEAALAKEFPVAPSVVASWRTGESSPDPKTQRKVAQAVAGYFMEDV